MTDITGADVNTRYSTETPSDRPLAGPARLHPHPESAR